MSIGIFVVNSRKCQSFKVGSFIALRYSDKFNYGVILRRCFFNCPSVTLLSDPYLEPCMEKDDRWHGMSHNANDQKKYKPKTHYRMRN